MQNKDSVSHAVLQETGSPAVTHQLIISSVQLMTNPVYGKCKSGLGLDLAGSIKPNLIPILRKVSSQAVAISSIHSV